MSVHFFKENKRIIYDIRKYRFFLSGGGGGVREIILFAGRGGGVDGDNF